MRQFRDEAAPHFIDFCVDCVDWSRFGLIGFTVVFQQLLSSLALARALKKRYPQSPIIMGGGAMEDDIADEIMKGCPQIDYVHCGDAEISFPQMVERLYSGQSMEGLQGIMWRDSEGQVSYAGRAPNFHDDEPRRRSRILTNSSTRARQADTSIRIMCRNCLSPLKRRAVAGGERKIIVLSAA